ncbi:uncharacterized protein J3D65DRAFT_262925 [Phyllosticta citribraziliensis]|uniref:Secreted protein n=1 Tax=Phyllosticta citribraziliensis TaxID=989973 RepID=A0ABR1M200_9PEZI
MDRLFSNDQWCIFFFFFFLRRGSLVASRTRPTAVCVRGLHSLEVSGLCFAKSPGVFLCKGSRSFTFGVASLIVAAVRSVLLLTAAGSAMGQECLRHKFSAGTRVTGLLLSKDLARLLIQTIGIQPLTHSIHSKSTTPSIKSDGKHWGFAGGHRGPSQSMELLVWSLGGTEAVRRCQWHMMPLMASVGG